MRNFDATQHHTASERCLASKWLGLGLTVKLFRVLERDLGYSLPRTRSMFTNVKAGRISNFGCIFVLYVVCEKFYSDQFSNLLLKAIKEWIAFGRVLFSRVKWRFWTKFGGKRGSSGSIKLLMAKSNSVDHHHWSYITPAARTVTPSKTEIHKNSALTGRWGRGSFEEFFLNCCARLSV